MELKRGDRGQLVGMLQAAIGVAADRAFGPATEAMVVAKRAALKLPSSHVADAALLDALGIGLIRGADVSHHNGAIDFAAMRASGIRFVWIKCTQNDGNADPMFRANVAAARAAGVLVGAYHFAIAGHGDVAAEMAWFLSHLDGLGALDLPAALDVETDPGDLSVAELCAWVEAARDLVCKATGKDPVLYTGSAFLRDQLGGCATMGGGMRLWIARYLGGGAVDPCAPPFTDLGAFDAYTVWQHSDAGTVPGCHGPVDLNWLPGGESALLSLCAPFYADGLSAPGN